VGIVLRSRDFAIAIRQPQFLLLDEFLTTGKTVSTRPKRLRGIQSALPRTYRRTRLKAIELWMA
jgi:hypothetical protein